MRVVVAPALAMLIGGLAQAEVRWPAAGEAMRVVHTRQTSNHFGSVRLGGWEVVEEVWRFGPRAPDGSFAIEIEPIAGHKASHGESDQGPIHLEVALKGPPAKNNDLWWQISQRARRRVVMAADGESVRSVSVTPKPAALEAEFLRLGGSRDAVPDLPKSLEQLESPTAFGRELPRARGEAWVEERALPTFLGATFSQTLWHRAATTDGGRVDLFDGLGVLHGSLAAWYLIQVDSNQVHGHSRFGADGHPRRRVERLQVEGSVRNPDRNRGPDAPARRPLRLDLDFETTWTPIARP